MKIIENWNILVNSEVSVVGLEYFNLDRYFLFRIFEEEAKQRHIPLYYWNLGYSTIKEIQVEQGNIVLKSTHGFSKNTEILDWLLSSHKPGIYLLDDLVEFETLTLQAKLRRESQIQNLIDYLRFETTPCYVILMAHYIQLSHKLKEIEVLKLPLPNAQEVQDMVKGFCKDNNQEFNPKLGVACQGLARGEISLILPRYTALAQNMEATIALILDYKMRQLRGLNLEFIANPDVSRAGGMDLLQEFLVEKVVKLNEPSARQYNLKPPKGLLLVGIPGTGKSLCAKLAAKSLGYSLLALSWGNVLGSDNPDRTLAQILETADALNKVILLADDFDKGFTDWNQGGVSQRLSQRLLTWMQEHTSDVMMVATVNRIQLLPSELKRRFDDGGIWFVDLPHMGAMYEVFRIHLEKYFPEQFGEEKDPWTERAWYRLLKAYRGATPVEIAQAVERCAINFYCGLTAEERQKGTIPTHIDIERLQEQLNEFRMASKRDAEELHLIRNRAYEYRPASRDDDSRFAIAPQQLFEYHPHAFENTV